MVKVEKLLILNLSTTSGRLSPLQIISKTGIRPPAFGLVEMEPLGSIGELRFQENLPHGLLQEDIPLSGCRKVALRLEDGNISHAARGGQPLLEPHSVRGGSSQQVYLRHVAPEDIHVYSVDEVMIDATAYLKLYNLTAHVFAKKMIQDVFQETGITATAGIGTNLYLCKVAMDIIAKHVPADKDGVRIGELDEMSYREKLWCHQPLTDFWRVGRGYAKKLNSVGLYTMGDIARCSLGEDKDFHNEELQNSREKAHSARGGSSQR